MLPLALLVVVLMFVLAPASAQALQVFSFKFGASGTAGGDFNSPQGVAVDQATGDVYVVDAGNFRVEKFTPDLATGSGNFDLAFGENVNTGAGNPDICTSSATCQAGTAGTSAGAFESPDFIAIDNSGGSSEGDVYVGDPGDLTVTKFLPSGALDTSFGTGGQLSGAATGTFGSMYGITVDSSGDLWLIDSSNSLWEFSSSGAAVTNFSTVRGMSPDGLDIGNSGNFFKVNGDGSVEEVTSSGSDVGSINEGATSTTGIAIDRATGDLYQDLGTSIDHYEFNASGAVVDIGGPCTVVPSGSCAPTDSFGSGDLTSGSGLAFDSSQSTLYVADSGGDDVAVFGPPTPGAPQVVSAAASNVSNLTATLNAIVNPYGNATTCEFQYGTTTSYGTTVPCPAGLGSSFEDQAASVNLTGLTINTTYHFRVVAMNSAGTVDGSDQTFTTLGAASIDLESASNVGSTYATLNTEVNPLGTDTTCEFQYGTTTSYGTTVTCPSDLGSGTSDVSASVNLTGLTINTTYHFRVVATNSLGTEMGQDATFTTLGAASIDSESASNVTTTTATLNTEINPLGTDTTCEFQYGTTMSYGTTVPCPSDLGSGTSDVSASVNVTGLASGATYHFRVVAFNSLAPSGVDGPDQTFTTVPPLMIVSESVSNATDSGGTPDTGLATLDAQINPLGTDTTCQFDYGTSTSYGSTVPCSPADLGSGNSNVTASASLTGLTLNTTYHFRVVATNSLVSGALGCGPGTTVVGANCTGPDQTFTIISGLPTILPDGRADELVSQSNTDNVSPFLRGGIDAGFEASGTGDAISSIALENLPNAQSYGISYLYTRGSSGWTTADMIPPQSPNTAALCSIYPGIVGYSADMSQAILQDGYIAETGCPTDDPPLVPGTTSGGLPLCSATPVVTPCSGEPHGVQNVFAFDGATDTYQLVSNLENAPPGVTPAKATFDGGSSDLSHVVFDESARLTSNAPSGGDDLYEWSGGTVSLVTQIPTAAPPSQPPTSCTGTTGAAACTPVVGSLAGGEYGQSLNAISADGSTIFFTANGNLYARENGSTTVQVDAGVGGGGTFVDASADGSTVFFSAGGNLYVDTVGSAPQAITSDGSFQGISGASEDGSIVYFVATGDLAGNAVSGDDNLYVNEPAPASLPSGCALAATGTMNCFIAVLSGSDSSDWGSGPTARVSSNGEYLVFDSVQSLTGYDNTDANTGNQDDEIFLYGATANQLSCVSCNPSGAVPTGNTVIDNPELIGIEGNVYYLQRYVSDSGQVFFDTPDELLPTDTNGVMNVYEYEGGQLRLISSGTSDANSYYIDSTPNGSDVFFATTQQLLPQDTNNGYDIYDARVGGGFPYSPPAPPCQGESCKPAPTSAPAPPPAATITFTGPGNLTASAAGRVKLLKRTVKGPTIRLLVSVPRAGLVVITGTDLARLARNVGHAGTFTITVHVTKTAKNRLKRKRRLKLTIGVRYAPVAGSSSSAKVKLTVKA